MACKCLRRTGASRRFQIALLGMNRSLNSAVKVSYQTDLYAAMLQNSCYAAEGGP
jgi:hypothetical protein